MKYNLLHNKKQSGFTLIELLVVIAIIGILASVVLASLNSARAKARDSQRKASLAQVRTALELYYDKYGTYQVAHAGWMDGGNGWLDDDTGDYGTSVVQALHNEGFLGADSVDDPIQNPGFMIYVCAGGRAVSLSATLENPSPADIAFIQTTCNGIGMNGTYTRYGKNYAIN